MSVVLPEGTPSTDRPRSRGRVIAFVLAALALALGSIVLGALTAPPPEATPEPTTTTEAVERPIDVDQFTVDQIVRGDPLQWEKAASAESGFPLALVEHDGWTYGFSSAAPAFAGSVVGGLSAWRSEDGSNWEALGQVIEPSQIVGGLAATENDLIAIAAGRAGDGMTLWRSSDGIGWHPEAIEVEGLTENMIVYPFAVGGADHTVVVASTTAIDTQRLIQETLTGVFGHEVSPASFRWSPRFDREDIGFEVWGPLGFPLVEISASDLSLNEAEMALLRSMYDGGRSGVETRVSYDGGEWLQGEIEDASWIFSIFATDTGQLLATDGNQGGRVWTSHDGFNWEQQIPGLGPDRIEEWDGMLVGPSRSGLPTVVKSHDGLDWETIGLQDHFPLGISWSMGVFDAGPGGIAATISGTTGSTADPEAEPVTLEDGEATLTIDYHASTYTVETSETTSTWSMSSSRQPDGIRVDPTSEMVAFSDIDTGEHLASFSFDELIEAEQAYWMMQSLAQEIQAFVFTSDGEDWTIQDASRSLAGASIQSLEVTDTHVVAAVVPSSGRLSPQSPGFEIWSAPIP